MASIWCTLLLLLLKLKLKLVLELVVHFEWIGVISSHPTPFHSSSSSQPSPGPNHPIKCCYSFIFHLLFLSFSSFSICNLNFLRLANAGVIISISSSSVFI